MRIVRTPAAVGTIIAAAGNRTNVTVKDTRMPRVIIQPKVETGRMSHTMREANPAIVVKDA